MNYEKRIKLRFRYVPTVFIIIGLVLIALSYVFEHSMLSSVGLIFVVLGIARLRRYRHITKDAESFRKYEVAETDERNVEIWTQARSLASSIYAIIACTAIIILYALDMQREANVVAINVYGFIAIYWISYFIIKRKY